MIKIKCKQCNKYFITEKWKKSVFCSRECYYKYQPSSPNKGWLKKGIKPWNIGKKCPQLSGKNHWNFGRTITKKHKQILLLSRKGLVPWNKDRHIKTNTGRTHFKKGQMPWNYNGGRITGHSGYILIKKPNHPSCNNLGYIREHRLIAEKLLNRYLTKQERIHHINEIKDDNCPENLYLFSCESKHQIYHHNVKNNKIQPITKSNLS